MKTVKFLSILFLVSIFSLLSCSQKSNQAESDIEEEEVEIIQQEGDYVSGITSFLRERGVAGSQPVVPSYISNIDDARITEAYIPKSSIFNSRC